MKSDKRPISKEKLKQRGVIKKLFHQITVDLLMAKIQIKGDILKIIGDDLI
jgi:hypothetical protein